jgi:hypothetical protein
MMPRVSSSRHEAPIGGRSTPNLQSDPAATTEPSNDHEWNPGTDPEDT